MIKIMPVIWLVLTLVFLVVEGTTVALITLWFAFGALAAMLTSFVCNSLVIQIIVFLAVSGTSLIFICPKIKEHLKDKEKTNIDAIIGRQGFVTQKIDNLSAVGEVKVDGKTWTARSVDGEIVEAGTLIEVVRIEGVKLVVKIPLS